MQTYVFLLFSVLGILPWNIEGVIQKKVPVTYVFTLFYLSIEQSLTIMQLRNYRLINELKINRVISSGFPIFIFSNAGRSFHTCTAML